MQRITVTKTETKTFNRKDGSGEGQFYLLTDEKGNEYSTFESILSDCKGAVLDIDIKLNRGKANIGKYVIVEPATKQANKLAPIFRQEPPNDIDARFRMAALDCSTRLYEIHSDQAVESAIIETAELYYNWLSGKTPEPELIFIKEPTIGELLNTMTQDAKTYGYTPEEMKAYINRTFSKPKSSALELHEVKEVIQAIRESRIKEEK